MTDLSEKTEPTRRNRPRWLLPAVTLVAMVLAGGGAMLATKAASSHGPSAAGGRAAPINGAPAAASSTVPIAQSGNSTQVGQSGGQDPGTAGPQPRNVQVGASTVTIPASWQLRSVTTDNGRTTGCLEGPGSPDGCDVWIVALADIPPDSELTVDQYRGFADVETMPGNCPIQTTAFSTRRLGDRTADYREFYQACNKVRSEQWTVPTWPAIQFTVKGDHPQLSAAGITIVNSARFTQPDSGKRVMDWGVLAGRSFTGNANHIKLDRIIRVYGGPDNGRDENSNHTTYDYALQYGAKVIDNGTLCADGTDFGRTCSLATVLRRIDQGKAGLVLLRFNTTGTVEALIGDYRP